MPWDALPGRMVRDGDLDEWRLVDEAERLPLSLHPAGAQAASARSASRAEPGEEALVVDDHALDGAAADDRPPGIRRLDLEPRRRPSTVRTTSATTVTCSPTALAARCSSATAVPTLDEPGGSRPSSARQVAASHQASSRGVPSTASPPEASASGRVVIRHDRADDAPVTHAGAHGDHRRHSSTVAERARGRSRYRG